MFELIPFGAQAADAASAALPPMFVEEIAEKIASFITSSAGPGIMNPIP